MHVRKLTLVALMATAAIPACRGGFRLTRYQTSQTLYQAALAEYQKRHWANAVAAFEKLTNDLPARDTLLPRSYWYLAQAHANQKEYLLAAQSYKRLYESFPDDTSADEAALEAGRSYRRMWRKPTLDPTYGEEAMATYGTLIGLFPEGESAEAARREITELEEMFALKNYLTGRYYYKRKAYDPAIIYLKTVLERWPHVPSARSAMILMAESYKKIRYREELNELCGRIQRAYPDDVEATRVCVGAVPVADSTAVATPPAQTKPPAP